MEFFNLHTHRFTNQDTVLELVNQYPQEFNAMVPYYSIGIHPWYIVEDRVAIDLAIIESKLKKPNCLAVGECGLDKRIEAPMELQQLVFERQLHLAQQHDKPVIIHCVAAFQEIIETKKRLNISVPMIIHGFSKNTQVANQLIANGFYISFGKYLMQNKELEEVFKNMPDNKIFLETDTIDDGIISVYQLAAKCKGISCLKMQKIINRNLEEVFKKSIIK
jgi:TatD DNase family protein